MNSKNTNHMFFLIYSFLLPIVQFVSCNTTEPPVPPIITTLSLTQAEISCTEVWLKLETNNLQLPATLNILTNDNITGALNLVSKDTVLYIDSLLPNNNYSYQLIGEDPGSKSNKLNVTTLDTTSHSFTWQTFEFGQHNSSVLYDVAIINENNIWAVGEIYLNDSLGNPDPTIYNAAHWDGQNWELKKLFYKGGIWTIRTIFAFNENDIWFSGYMRYLNENFIELPIPNILMGWSIDKIWGSSSNDLYAVGSNGNISHYNGTSWIKIESGTTDNLNDIWGMNDEKTVWTCGYSGDYANTVLIRIKDGVAEKVYEGSSNVQSNGYYVGPMSGVWTDNDYKVFLMTGSGIYIQKNSSEFFLEKEIARFSYGSYGIDGTKYNDIFACGDRFVGHWNGATYYEYPELYRQFRTYYNISNKGNIVCVVGTDYSDALNFGAIIALGHK